MQIEVKASKSIINQIIKNQLIEKKLILICPLLLLLKYRVIQFFILHNHTNVLPNLKY